MDCFIKKIFLNKIDEDAHRQFVRFGKGNYSGRAVLKLQKGEKIKLGGSSEYANDFVSFVAENSEAKFSGIVLSREELSELQGKKKAGVFEYEFSGNSADVKKLGDKAYAMLLDAQGSGITLKMKKKLPKPGKSREAKIDDKFCIIEADLRYWQKIREAFFWDIGECKKVRVVHEYIIDSIVMPEDEKDFEQIRLKAKRKGRIIRKLEVDKQEKKEEKDMEV